MLLVEIKQHGSEAVTLAASTWFPKMTSEQLESHPLTHPASLLTVANAEQQEHKVSAHDLPNFYG